MWNEIASWQRHLCLISSRWRRRACDDNHLESDDFEVVVALVLVWAQIVLVGLTLCGQLTRSQEHAQIGTEPATRDWQG